ncbi:MAG: hypothetical protein GWM98_15440 [Nitrospinaceae bacterium]|nr:hypothetical protein [Nitrospinaceae bacterium]NIR55618.1 hypothetical protein [Nitrospinaceae bacterium]NIS86052.1 hypothetical protein [Nitrospinaceae bacterium]NIT82895.1 hypothetical protein [Nitrospinaceae bacterium]NIU45100.1 hypothetical protein [Nitrospinaceae bacterium]
MADLQKDSVGVTLQVTVQENGVAVDISAATTRQIIITKPDRSKLTKTATFVTDGSDGKIQYVTVAGDLDLAGTYSLQAFVITPAGEYYTEITNLFVAKNL